MNPMNSAHRYALPVLAALVLASASCTNSGTEPVPAATSVTAFEGARVLVGDGTDIDNATIVVDGPRIVQVGRAAEVTVPAGAQRVSLSGKTVMPAIVDTHTHLSQTREALTEDLLRRAYFGVGAAMSLGQDRGDVPFQMRAESLPGAALYRTAGRGITMPEPGRSDAPYWITSEAEGRKAVQELAAQKVDFVKIWVDDRNGQYKKLTPDLYGPIIEEAHKNGLRVTAHIFALEDAKGLLRAGVDAFAHGIRDRDVDDEVMALFKERPDVVVVPNLPDRGVATDLGWLRGSVAAADLTKLQEAAVDRPEAQKAFGIQARNLARLSAAGVRIALGTDGNTPWGPHLEMADMVSAGMTPAQVIAASTSQAAQLMRLPDAGLLSIGKSADFIVLDASPLGDIANTRRISAVYLRGDEIDRAGYRSKIAATPTQ